MTTNQMSLVRCFGKSDRRGIGHSFRDGFSLVEMLMVIAVIALLIAMLLPALAGARNTALRVSTQSMLADFTNAVQRFGNDNAGRNPGYFSEADMGHSENLIVGMSAMENAMLELGGTAAVLGSEADPDVQGLIDVDNGIIAIGPRTETDELPRAVVNINLIGAEGAYYTPDAKFWKAQDQDNSNTAGQFGSADGEGQEFMPDLLDAWGNPLLAWSQDQSARGSILVKDGDGGSPQNVYTQFARVQSDGLGDEGQVDGPAWFYLASNAAFLEAPSFGGSGINMGADPLVGSASVLSEGVLDDIDRLTSLAAMLASPSSFQLDPGVDGLDDAVFADVFPSAPRGRFMVHSAGRDGIFMNSTGEGWKTNANIDTGYNLNFGNNHLNQNTDTDPDIGFRIVGDNGAFTNTDVFESFDDVLFSAK